MKGYCRMIKTVCPDLLAMSRDELFQNIERYIESVEETVPEKVEEAKDVIIWCEKRFDRHLNCMTNKQLRIVTASLIDWGRSTERKEHWRKRLERWRARRDRFK